jgi:hypothetical protein
LDTGVEKLTVGRDYWLAITPPNAFKAIPREYGTGEHTVIVFAIPARER